MKVHSLFFCLWAMIPAGLAAQVQLRNLSLVSPDSAVLYIGIPNKLAVSGFKESKNITLRYADHIVVSPEKDGIFYVSVSTMGNMSIAVLQGRRKLKEISFAVRQLTDPVVVLGNWQGNSIPKDSLLLNRQLRVILPNCLINFRDEVLNFDLQIITRNQTGPVHHIKGYSIPDELLPQLLKLQSGDELLFSNIRSISAFIADRFRFSLKLQ